jgi:16S rRNA (guanine(966)-N(2))-methyltransferase RsmD
MRIIAGELKGRRLAAPPGDTVRPTSDSLRETLFNVLGDSVRGARVLDAFAGTGALGLEALSRGAARVTFVERDAKVIAILEKNIEHCGVRTAVEVVRGSFGGTRRARVSGPFDLVMLDPPYASEGLNETLELAASLVATHGQLVLEHSRRRESPASVKTLSRTRLLEAGDSALSFYRKNDLGSRFRSG